MHIVGMDRFRSELYEVQESAAMRRVSTGCGVVLCGPSRRAGEMRGMTRGTRGWQIISTYPVSQVIL